MFYKYPSNIEEAAKILDKVMPEWYKKIDLKILNLREGKRCILGQLYGNYDAGMKHIFNVDMSYTENRDIFLHDKVFGMSARVLEWEFKINKRLKEGGVNFLEALALMKQGKKVRRKSWYNSYYISLNKDSGAIFTNEGTRYVYCVSDLEATDWQEYEYNTIDDLNVGDLVTLHSDTLLPSLVDVVCTIVQDIDGNKHILGNNTIYKNIDSRLTLLKKVNANN